MNRKTPAKILLCVGGSIFISVFLTHCCCPTARVGRPPVAVLQATPTSGTAPLTVTFDLSKSYDSDGKIVGFELMFGDETPPVGGTDISSPIKHTYYDDGYYLAILKVIDDQGLSACATLGIKVGNPAPIAEFSWQPQTPVMGETVIFDACSSIDPATLIIPKKIVTYQWDFGDGTKEFSSACNITHVYANAGSYSVRLIVYDDDGDSATVTKSITIVPAPGTLKWRFFTGTYVFDPAIGFDGTVYFGSEDTLYAVNPDGTEKWRFVAARGVVHPPVISSDGTIFITDSGALYAIDPHGIQQWRFDAGGRIIAPPAIDADGTLYFGSDDGYFYAVTANGTEKWRFASNIFCRFYDAPAIGRDRTIYVTCSDELVRTQFVYALDPNGIEKWRFAVQSSNITSVAIGADDTIYFGSYDGNVYALYPDGREKWRFTIGSWIRSAPAVGPDGTIYVGADDNYLYALNPNGTMKWRFHAGDGVTATPAIGDDGTIYFTSQNGYLFAVNSDGTKKWDFIFGGWASSSPAIAEDGTIYFGTLFAASLYALWSSSHGLASSSWPRFQHDNQNTGRVW